MAVNAINSEAIADLSHILGVVTSNIGALGGIAVDGGSVTTSYANWGGTGNRKGDITISGDGFGGAGAGLSFIDGDTADTLAWFTSSLTFVTFYFGAPRVIDEAKLYQSDSSTHGDWKWQGSNNGSSWTDIGSSFTLGGTATQTITALSGNVTAYKFYRLLKVSGTASSSPYIHEFEFKLDVPAGSSTSYANAGGTGDRTASITVSPLNSSEVSGGYGGATPQDWVDGLTNDSDTWFTDQLAFLEFDFGTGKVIDEAKFYQDTASVHGVWKWQGSNDGTSWTDIGYDFTFGAVLTQTLRSLYGNVTSYRYYRLVNQSGAASAIGTVSEFEFKIN